MKKRVIQLNENELAKMIKDITMSALNEMDGATYAHIYNASHKAENQILNGNYSEIRTINNKSNNTTRDKEVNYDDIIAKARKLEKIAQKHWLKDYVGKTFKFFGEDRLGLVADILFTFERITKFSKDKTVLVGDVVFNDLRINGDGIILNLNKGKVSYHEKGSRYEYTLVADPRTAKVWDNLVEQIKMTLDSRKY